MNISSMDVRITFQRSTAVVDKYGNHRNEWTDHFVCWSTASVTSGKESDGTVIVPEENTNFTVRYCRELEDIDPTKYRIICRGKIYNIYSVNPMGFHKKSLKFSCRLERRKDGKDSQD